MSACFSLRQSAAARCGALVLAFATAVSAKPLRSGDRIDRKTSPPYTGDLSIFEDPKRDENLQVNRVMDLLHVRESSAVADIGAGSGWFAVRAARRVGPRGTVYAVEINEDYLRQIAARAQKENLPNIRCIRGGPDDPMLSNGSVDAVLLLKTYHEIANPIALLRHTGEALRPGGLLGIIDRNGNGEDHGLDRGRVVQEAKRAGFQLLAAYDFVKGDGDDYFLVFTRRALPP